MPEQTIGGSMDWVQPVIQLVTAGGFGALVWYFVVKLIPSVEARHKEERAEIEQRHKDERSAWLSYIDKRDMEFQALFKANSEALAKNAVELHDLKAIMDTVRETTK